MTHPAPPPMTLPSQPAPARRELPGVVQGLISVGMVTAIFVIWTILAAANSGISDATESYGVTHWISFLLGLVAEGLFVLILFFWARSRRQGMIGAGIALGFFAVNRVCALLLALSFSGLGFLHDLYDIVVVVGFFLFLIGLFAGWTFARSRSTAAWIGFGVAAFLALVGAVIEFVVSDGLVSSFVTVDHVRPVTAVLLIGLIILVAVGVGLGIITAADTIGVALARNSAPQAGRPLPGQFPTGPAGSTFPPAPTGGHVPGSEHHTGQQNVAQTDTTQAGPAPMGTAQTGTAQTGTAPAHVGQPAVQQTGEQPVPPPQQWPNPVPHNGTQPLPSQASAGDSE